jgi:hypothetical protein
VFRQRVNVTLCRNNKLFETAAKGSGSYRLNENYKPNRRGFSYLFDQPNTLDEPTNRSPAVICTPMDNISFESVEDEKNVFVKLEGSVDVHASNTESYEILEFLSTDNHTLATHPPMMITNSNIIFPRWDQPQINLTSALENSMETNNELVQMMLQVSQKQDPQSLGLVPNLALSSNALNAGPNFGHSSYLEYHTVMCESCEQPSIYDDERFILSKFALLPGPQDKNYMYTCGSCSCDGFPNMMHKIKNRYNYNLPSRLPIFF